RAPETGAIVDMCWYVQNLCTRMDADNYQPEEAVYLNEAFGDDTPQVLSFTFADDEFALYMSSDSELADEIYAFLQEKRSINIVSTIRRATDATKWDNKLWTVAVTAYPSYP